MGGDEGGARVTGHLFGKGLGGEGGMGGDGADFYFSHFLNFTFYILPFFTRILQNLPCQLSMEGMVRNILY